MTSDPTYKYKFHLYSEIKQGTNTYLEDGTKVSWFKSNRVGFIDLSLKLVLF